MTAGTAGPPTSAPVVVGASARMRALFDVARVVAGSDGAVLITGETGTGKEVLATAIHQASGRRHGPFVPVSCAALPESLIESELFGHERSAVTGALRERPGRFELASGGTIFLEDIDDAPTSIQVKLARVLQDRVIERVGGHQPLPVDVRVIAASRRDVAELVAQGRFREDLFHQVSVVTLALPPLRDHREDIPGLMRHFLARAFAREGGTPPSVPAHIEEAFLRYEWPGNVRELENACERIAQTCTCGVVRTGCVAPQVLFHRGQPSAPHAAVAPPQGSSPISLDDRLREVEASLIAWALGTARGNKSRAAELLQIKRTTLADRITRLGARLHEAGRPDTHPAGGGTTTTTPEPHA